MEITTPKDQDSKGVIRIQRKDLKPTPGLRMSAILVPTPKLPPPLNGGRFCRKMRLVRREMRKGFIDL